MANANAYPDYSEYIPFDKPFLGKTYTRLYLNAFPRSVRRRYIDPHYIHHKQLGPYYYPEYYYAANKSHLKEECTSSTLGKGCGHYCK